MIPSDPRPVPPEWVDNEQSFVAWYMNLPVRQIPLATYLAECPLCGALLMSPFFGNGSSTLAHAIDHAERWFFEHSIPKPVTITKET